MNKNISKVLSSEQGSKSGVKGLPKRNIVLYPKGDKIALIFGIFLTLSAVAFFTWVMINRLSQDWALQPVPVSTPTPPLKPLIKS